MVTDRLRVSMPMTPLSEAPKKQLRTYDADIPFPTETRPQCVQCVKCGEFATVEIETATRLVEPQRRWKGKVGGIRHYDMDGYYCGPAREYRTPY